MRDRAITTMMLGTDRVGRGDLVPVLIFSLGGLLITALVCIAVPDWAVSLFEPWAWT
jgi:hypothetical protein